MQGGRRTAEGTIDLHEARERARKELARLPDRIQVLAPADPPYPVLVSDRLQAYQHAVMRKVAG